MCLCKNVQHIGMEFAGQKIKKIEFVFSTKPPREILDAFEKLEEYNIFVKWICGD